MYALESWQPCHDPLAIFYFRSPIAMTGPLQFFHGRLRPSSLPFGNHCDLLLLQVYVTLLEYLPNMELAKVSRSERTSLFHYLQVR